MVIDVIRSEINVCGTAFTRSDIALCILLWRFYLKNFVFF